MVISLASLYSWPYSAFILAAMAARKTGTPAIGGYWFSPCRMALLTTSTKCGSQLKSGKPWPRLTAFFSLASADMTVKMVVPILGSLDWMAGVFSVLIDVINQLRTELACFAVCGLSRNA